MIKKKQIIKMKEDTKLSFFNFWSITDYIKNK